MQCLLSSELHHEQEEPDSACEATQYFFEDITPETSSGTAASSHSLTIWKYHKHCDHWYWCFDLSWTGLDPKNRTEKDDGFVRVTFKNEKGGRNIFSVYIDENESEFICLNVQHSIRLLSVCDVVKKTHTPDYRTYLRLWNQETKAKLENMKDLPKLNQVHLETNQSYFKTLFLFPIKWKQYLYLSFLQLKQR